MSTESLGNGLFLLYSCGINIVKLKGKLKPYMFGITDKRQVL